MSVANLGFVHPAIGASRRTPGSATMDRETGGGNSGVAGLVIARPARAPNTSPSSSELLARRFAPCTRVHATSPAANRPGTDVRPSRSVSTPPIM